MAIPDITQSNPLTAALDEANRNALNVDSTYIPLVTTPQSLIQEQQFQLDQNRALNNAMWGSADFSPLGQAIMPKALTTGYTAGKDTLATNKDFSRFNQEFNKQFYNKHADKDKFPTYSEWIKGGTFSSIHRGLQNRSVDIKADEHGNVIFNPVRYKGDKKSTLDSPINLKVPIDYYQMDKNKFEEKYPNLVKEFGGYESLGKSEDFKYLDEYTKAFGAKEGFTPRGVFSRPFSADYTADIEDKGDWTRSDVQVDEDDSALANAVMDYEPNIVKGPLGPINLNPDRLG